MLDYLTDGWIVNAVARCLIVEKRRDELNRLAVFRISLLMLSQSANSWRERNTYSLEGLQDSEFYTRVTTAGGIVIDDFPIDLQQK